MKGLGRAAKKLAEDSSENYKEKFELNNYQK